MLDKDEVGIGVGLELWIKKEYGRHLSIAYVSTRFEDNHSYRPTENRKKQRTSKLSFEELFGK